MGGVGGGWWEVTGGSNVITSGQQLQGAFLIWGWGDKGVWVGEGGGGGGLICEGWGNRRAFATIHLRVYRQNETKLNAHST